MGPELVGLKANEWTYKRGIYVKAAGPETQVKKPKRAEPTVRLRKAMGLPLRQGEPLFDDKFKKGLPIK